MDRRHKPVAIPTFPRTVKRDMRKGFRNQKMPDSAMSGTTYFVLVLLAFTMAFSLGLASLHYQDKIESVLAGDGVPWSAGFDKQVSVATSVADIPPRGRCAVQVAAYESRAQAEALARRLSTHQEEVIVSPAQINGKMYYRVRIPTEKGADAERLAASLRRELGVDAWVVSLP